MYRLFFVVSNSFFLYFSKSFYDFQFPFLIVSEERSQILRQMPKTPEGFHRTWAKQEVQNHKLWNVSKKEKKDLY